MWKYYFLSRLTFAHLAFAASEIFFLAAALIVRFLGAAFVWLADPLLRSSRRNSLCKESILSLMFAACRSCFDVSSIIGVFGF